MDKSQPASQPSWFLSFQIDGETNGRTSTSMWVGHDDGCISCAIPEPPSRKDGLALHFTRECTKQVSRHFSFRDAYDLLKQLERGQELCVWRRGWALVDYSQDAHLTSGSLSRS